MGSPVEAKVKASAAAALVAGIVVWLLGRYVLHGAVAAGYTAEIDAAVPALFAAVAGYLAPHTARPPVPAAPSNVTVTPPPAAHP